jgi:hypothetical protein
MVDDVDHLAGMEVAEIQPPPDQRRRHPRLRLSHAA